MLVERLRLGRFSAGLSQAALGQRIGVVPAHTDSRFFHGTLSADAGLFFLLGRVPFLDTRGKGQHTPFSLMLVVFGATVEQMTRYAGLVQGRWIPRTTMPIADDDRLGVAMAVS